MQKSGRDKQHIAERKMIRNVRQGIIVKTAYYRRQDQKYTCRRSRNEPRRRKYHMPRQLDGTPLQMLEINWSGQSLIRFMESYHALETEEIHNVGLDK